MAAKYDFRPIVKGNTFQKRTFTVKYKNGAPIDFTGASICMQMRSRPGGSVIHDFKPTIYNGSLGQIEIPQWDVDLNPGAYNYDLTITLADTTKLTYLQGSFVVLQNISQCL